MGVSGSGSICECRLKTDGNLLSEMDLKMVGESRDSFVHEKEMCDGWRS